MIRNATALVLVFLSSMALARETKEVLEGRTAALTQVLAALDDAAVKGVSPDLLPRHAAFKAQIATYRGAMPAPVEDAAVKDVAAMLARGAPSAEIAAAARGLRRRMITTFELVASPLRTPTYAPAAAAFQEHCARCHGKTGAGDGVLATKIVPAMASFIAPTLHQEASPFRFYERIGVGVGGTAMPAFRGKLDDNQLWSLAFYVASLPYSPPAAADLRATWRSVPESERALLKEKGLTLERLSLDGNIALSAWLATAMPAASAERRAEILDLLRSAAPFSGDVKR